MGLHRRLVVALAALLVAFLTACGGPPPETRSVPELLQVGDAELAAVHFPAEWQPKATVSERYQGKLRWQRNFVATGASADAREMLDQLLTTAGWTRNDDCMGSNGEKCFSYDKGGLNIFPTITDIVCSDGQPGCAFLQIGMSQNWSQPI